MRNLSMIRALWSNNNHYLQHSVRCHNQEIALQYPPALTRSKPTLLPSTTPQRNLNLFVNHHELNGRSQAHPPLLYLVMDVAQLNTPRRRETPSAKRGMCVATVVLWVIYPSFVGVGLLRTHIILNQPPILLFSPTILRYNIRCSQLFIHIRHNHLTILKYMTSPVSLSLDLHIQMIYQSWYKLMATNPLRYMHFPTLEQVYPLQVPLIFPCFILAYTTFIRADYRCLLLEGLKFPA